MVSAHGGWASPWHRSCAPTQTSTASPSGSTREHGRLDILVLDFWGDESPVPFGTPFWEIPCRARTHDHRRTLWPHVLTLQALVPLMLRGRTAATRPPGLVVEVMDGPALYYRTSLFFDLAATLRARLAYAVAEELAPHGITALAVSPGYLRSELDARSHWASPSRTGATRPRRIANFLAVRDAVLPRPRPGRAGRRSRFAAARRRPLWIVGARQEYGITDVDGATPDFGRHMEAAYGESPGPLHTKARWQVGIKD